MAPVFRTQRLSLPRSLSAPLTWALALLVLLAAGCGDSGGSTSLTGGGPPGTGIPDVRFSLRRDLAVGPGFLSDVLWADFDLDGRLDLIQSHFRSRRVTLSRGMPDGSFELAAELPTRGGPWRLSLFDADASGRPDLLVCTLDQGGSGERGLELWLQARDGRFLDRAFLPLAFQPLDLAVLPTSGRAGAREPAKIWLADRDGRRLVRASFQPGPLLVEDGELPSVAAGRSGQPVGLALLDRRGDGWLDLAVAETGVGGGSPDRVVVFEGGPSGLVAGELAHAPLFGPLVRNAGDVNGDGRDDLAISQLGSQRAFLLPGEAAGFAPAISLDVGGATSALHFSDLDGDGLLDLTAALFQRDAVSVRLANSNLSWDEPHFLNLGFQPRGLTTAALGGLPWPSILCGNAMDVSILDPLAPGVFAGARGFETLSEGPITVRTGDLDQDGDLDAVVMTARQTSIVFYEGDGAGGLVSKSIVPLVPGPEENYGHLVIADVDRDGLLDVTATVLQANELRFFKNTGTVGGFGQAPTKSRFVTGEKPTGLDLADLDGDGFLDAVIGSAGDRTIETLFGSASGFRPRAGFGPVELGTRPAEVRAADLDGDGHVDVTLTSGGEGTPERLFVLAGDGSGRLELVFESALDVLSGSLEIADLDGDGHLDLVVGQPGVEFDELYLFFGEGELAFESRKLSAGPDPEVCLIEDLDFDGVLDLLVISGVNDVSLAVGDGTREFAPAVRLGDSALPFRAQEAVLADLDGDGLLDLLCVSSDLPFLWHAQNRSPFALDAFAGESSP